MECRPLEVTVMSAKDLKDVNVFGKMDVYVVASLSGDKTNKRSQRTRVHTDGGTNPQWGHTVSFTVDLAAARAGRLTLKLKIKAERTLGGDKDVGRVDVPVRELLDQGGGAGDGKPKPMSYSVRLPSGKTKGVLEFSYKFGEQFTVAAPPAGKKVDGPVMAYPAHAAPPASSSAAAYPPPHMMQGAAPYPPQGGYPPQGPGGYPPQGYGYPPNAAPGYGYPPQGHGYPPQGHGYPPQGYGYAAPQPAYQKPPKKSGGGGFGLGLAGGLLGGMLIGDMISDAADCGFDDGGFDL
ncbi:protein SRC2 homolog [Rhodamnia argentea]|uniref:Protein SRC2 homolog n=1 Tax=Rhodamnia argentea TaxID=178133 RepID=A0A8B8QF87_9MYRT|nr:protein SRC2 homolog [Rhodamnia argentea]